ncbi:MAG: permease-like cell division protein FtsX [Candidatus Marinamargulisbacteria bacterium]
MINSHAIIFFLKETAIGLRRSSLMTLIAVATITITLIILGLFMLISANLGKVTGDIVSKLEVRLFLKPNLAIEDIQLFRRKLRSIEGVKDVVFINNTEAWQQFQSDYSHLALKNYVDANPLPHSLNIKLHRTRDLKSIILYIKRFDTIIDDIVYGGELADRVEVFRRVMFVSGWSLIGLLIMASLFIIMNTIRLTVIARDEEIGIMQLVGATHRFIKGPFLIEGFVIGIVGASGAVGILYFIYALIIHQLMEKMPFFPFIADHSSLYYIYGFVLLSGSIIGMLGAYIAVSRSLK